MALDALKHELFEEVAACVETALADGFRDDPSLYHILGVARRGLLDGPEAHAAFLRAAELSPSDSLIAHGAARSAWEAGLPATSLYRRALKLAPNDAGVLLGHAASLVADGSHAEALQSVSDLLKCHPGWHEGHHAYARICAVARNGGDSSATVRSALIQFPADHSLWRTLFRLLLDERRYEEAGEAATEAIGRFGSTEEWQRVRAISLGESGQPAEAQLLFDSLTTLNSASALVHPVRNLIRLGRLQDALVLAERRFPASEEMVLWPYRALLWRATADPRWEWLEGEESLIGEYQVASAEALAPLADALRQLHGGAGEMAGQSVRGGSQTDGQLLARAAPEIRHLRDILIEAAANHLARLPAATPGHPTLIEQRTPFKMVGSWSVRLSQGGGFHVDHVHSQGWFSSAFYVTVPEDVTHTNEAGWLVFGECRELLPELRAFRSVCPQVGKLVMFPSTMWHGTRPIAAGERMSVAFDIGRPQKIP